MSRLLVWAMTGGVYDVAGFKFLFDPTFNVCWPPADGASEADWLRQLAARDKPPDTASRDT
ncbi:MAG: hypothetical protein SFX18_17700 [Pirellulales bacterium]|nr:hypothetical protein [Pirellulales bacterium]